jgi:hypothetical protein
MNVPHPLSLLNVGVRAALVLVALVGAANLATGLAFMIVMGGYVHSRLRELVFGGVTQSLLKQSPVPLFLSYRAQTVRKAPLGGQSEGSGFRHPSRATFGCPGAPISSRRNCFAQNESCDLR